MDLDGDGRRAILSGSYSRMDKSMAGLFQVLRARPDGAFRKAEALHGTDGKPLIIPVEGDNWVENICTRPFAVDWDGDGKLDLVVGNFTGTFYVFQGQGKGKFLPTPAQLKAGGKPLKLQGHHSDPFVIDWDGDGDLDLLSGSSEGGLQWAENRAGKGKPPELQPFAWLIKPSPPRADGQILLEESLTGPSHDTRIWVDDLNGDGKLDVLMGDTTTLVSPAGKLSPAEFKQKYAQWQEALSKIQLSPAADDDKEGQEKRRNEGAERFRKLYAERSKFMKEERTGFVWLYLQK